MHLGPFREHPMNNVKEDQGEKLIQNLIFSKVSRALNILGRRNVR